MLKLKSIYIKNLGSHSDSKYFFKNNLDIIVGLNKDTSSENLKELPFEELVSLDGLVSSNGSGKSMIAEAINLALFGDNIRPKINSKDIIKEGENNCQVILIGNNDFLELSEIKIIRNLYSSKSKSSTLQIFETKNEVETEIKKSSIDELNNYIINNYIGLSKEDLINFYIIQKERFCPFLLLTDTKKKEILSRFLGINKYSFVEDKIKKELSNLDTKKIFEEKNISKSEGKIEILNSNIDSLPSKEEFLSKNESLIEGYKSEIKELKLDIENTSKAIEELVNNKNYYLQLFNHWNLRKERFYTQNKNNKYLKESNDIQEKISNVENELKEFNDVLIEIDNLTSFNNKELNKIGILNDKLKVLLSTYITCPKCHYKFDPKGETNEDEINEKINSSNIKVKSIEKKLEEIAFDKKEIKELFKLKQKESKDIENERKSLKKTLRRIEGIGDSIEDCINIYNTKLRNLSTTLDIKRDKVKRGQLSINSLENQIIDIETKSNYKEIEDKKKKYLLDIKKEKEAIEEFLFNIKKIEKEIQVNKDANLCFINFKNYLYNKMLFNIQIIVNDYLQQFSNLSIELKGNKILADGKSIRDEINVIVKRGDKEISYYLLSSGEKACIDISFILCFQHILNIISNNGLNLLILDEITGIDSVNQEKILKILDNLKTCILFISHVNIKNDFNKTYIIKENNNSQIIN